MTLRPLLLVFAGGSVGTAARLAVGLAVPDAGGVPVATLLVNVLGALLIGILAARLPQTTGLRVFLGTGVLGGFTTYSALMTGTDALWAHARCSPPPTPGSASCSVSRRRCSGCGSDALARPLAAQESTREPLVFVAAALAGVWVLR